MASCTTTKSSRASAISSDPGSPRAFAELTRLGLLRAGVFGSAWAAFLRSGSVAAAYPDELLSIEQYSKGRLKPGDVIDAGNVDLVKALLDPVRFAQISLGRKLVLASTTTDLTRLNPSAYLEATARNKGRARFDANGNIVTNEASRGSAATRFPSRRRRSKQYQYASVWAEMAAVGRTVVEPKPYWPGDDDKLRYQSILFTEPADAKGTMYLNVWPYDQRPFPQLYGYLPALPSARSKPLTWRGREGR